MSRHFLLNWLYMGVLTALLVLLLMTPHAQAASSKVYTVAKFYLRATASDAVQAKKKAIAEGEIRAFRVLLKRLTAYDNYYKLPKLRRKLVQQMIAGVSVRKERNSRTEYLATFDFRFRPTAVQKLLQSHNVPFSDKQALPTVLVPVFHSEDESKNKASRQRMWRKAWSTLDLKNAIAAITLGQVKAALTPEKLSAVLSGDADAFDELYRDYGVERFVLAVAKTTEDKKKLSVRLIGKDAVGALDLTRSYRIPEDYIEDATDLAAEISLAIFEERWKIANADGTNEVADTATSEAVLMTVEFSGFREWQKIRARLSKVPGIGEFDVSSLSARGADITLSYPGGAQGLSQILAAHNLVLENIDGSWILRSF